MLHPGAAASSSTTLEATNDLERGLYCCDQSPDANVVAYVSKMFAVRRNELPESKPKELTAEEMRQKGREERERRAALLEAGEAKSEPTPLDKSASLSKSLDDLELDQGDQPVKTLELVEPIDPTSEVLLGFSRVYSGLLKRDTQLLATLPKYDPSLGLTHPRNARHVIQVKVRDLYMMMGRELVAVGQVPAGHVCAIGGLEGVVPRNATLWAQNSDGFDGKREGVELINMSGISLQVN